MSTKTIAVDSQVYSRLAALKSDGESFSTAIGRLLGVGAAHTGQDILNGLANVPELSQEDSEAMLAVVADNRESESWDHHDLR